MNTLTDNMKAMLIGIAEASHGIYNGGVVTGLLRRGLLCRKAYKGLVLTEKGYFMWLFLKGRIGEETLEELLKGAADD